ncbi:hypothetical protein TRVA0_043S00892 [Trichomonascus vanleenenianus]|uniref:uncharacterized protein n=1 Tax=Trichomonascus vanleenenianus TaxID=2268995 RepID=UPI003EC973F3
MTQDSSNSRDYHEKIDQALQLSRSLKQLCNSLLEEGATSDVKRELMTQVVLLRQYNREAQNAVKSLKEDTNTRKLEVDSKKLDIQNITYQHKHLRTEIERCENYEAKHETLDLIPVEEFLAEHPEHKDLDDHELTLARLRDEEEKRLELFQQKTKLNETRKMLLQDTKSLKEDLEDMKAFELQVNKWLDGAEPLRRTFDRH